MLGPLSETMVQRYEPQFQQFELSLTQKGAGLFGSSRSASGKGSAWVMPVSKHCMVLEHTVVPSKDMQLLEITPKPYACISKISAPTLECMNETNIDHTRVEPRQKTHEKPMFCTFVHQACEEEYSPLKAGRLYYSRSIIFEPEYFSNLEQIYPGQFAQMFNSFAKTWNEQAYHTISATLNNLNMQRSQQPAAHLYAQSVINAMLANLTVEQQASQQAENRAGDHAQKQLVSRAINIIHQAISQGENPNITSIASKLYVSRSVLCAAFKQEEGESIGAFTRHLRNERAEHLLLHSNLSIAQIAFELGYSQQSSFTQSFTKTYGASPVAWRELHR